MSVVHKILRGIGYVGAGLIAIALVNSYAWAGYTVLAIWTGLVIREIVKEAVREVIRDELNTLFRQSYTNAERSEVIERKVGAIWDRIRAISTQ